MKSCVYCGRQTNRQIKIAESSHSSIPKDKRGQTATATRLRKADQVIPVCSDHFDQVMKSLRENTDDKGRLKGAAKQQRTKVLEGQMSIDDYLL